MKANGALGLLFPNRRAASVRALTPLQEALKAELTALAQIPELRQAGLGQFLPPLISGIGQMNDDHIRSGREMMRRLVWSLDDADETGFTPAKPLPGDDDELSQHTAQAVGADDPRRSDGDGQDDASPSPLETLP